MLLAGVPILARCGPHDQRSNAWPALEEMSVALLTGRPLGKLQAVVGVAFGREPDPVLRIWTLAPSLPNV